MDFEELLNGVMSGQLTNQMFIDIGIIILVIAIILIIISLFIVLIANRRSREEKIATNLLKKVSLMRKGKFKSKIVKEPPILEKKEELQIKKGELTLKEMLIKKFKPIIEKQLHSKVEFVDFNANKDRFIAKINVQGHVLELNLDSSGKILDYKNLDKP